MINKHQPSIVCLSSLSTGVDVLSFILESLIIGDFSVWKAIMMLAVYVVYMVASFLMLWKKS